jgi:hypothetical protein
MNIPLAAYLLPELQTLITETKKKHPEIKEVKFPGFHKTQVADKFAYLLNAMKDSAKVLSSSPTGQGTDTTASGRLKV